jgi:hypothetical protein
MKAQNRRVRVFRRLLNGLLVLRIIWRLLKPKCGEVSRQSLFVLVLVL